MSGRSLVPLIDGDRDSWRRFVFTSAKASSDRYADRPYELDSQRKIYSVRSDDWKLINYPGVDGDYWELYDLQSDPMERSGCGGSEPRDSAGNEDRPWPPGSKALDEPSFTRSSSATRSARSCLHWGIWNENGKALPAIVF